MMSSIVVERVVSENRIDTPDLVPPVYQTGGKWSRCRAIEFSDTTSWHTTSLLDLISPNSTGHLFILLFFFSFSFFLCITLALFLLFLFAFIFFSLITHFYFSLLENDLRWIAASKTLVASENIVRLAIS